MGSELGHFLFMEECLEGEDKRVGQILVEIDTHKGLLAKVESEWRGRVYCQQIDYWGLPFRCSFCNQKGHLHHKCQASGSRGDRSRVSIQSKFHGGITKCVLPEVEGSIIEAYSFMGKLKNFSPYLFSSLSSEDKYFLSRIDMRVYVGSNDHSCLEGLIGEVGTKVLLLDNKEYDIGLCFGPVKEGGSVTSFYDCGKDYVPHSFLFKESSVGFGSGFRMF